jgi:trimethylamine:corrinoid methyltransferase-like protein
MAERAADRVEAILAEHRPEALPKKVAEAVQAIVARAGTQYGEARR